jgi:hypothetical protein
MNGVLLLVAEKETEMFVYHTGSLLYGILCLFWPPRQMIFSPKSNFTTFL